MPDIFETLATTLAKQGAPVLGGMIGTAIGGPAGAAIGGLAGKAIESLADALGVPATPEAVTQAVQAPGAAAKVAEIESDAKDLWQKEAETYRALVDREAGQGWFYSAWRPAGMWLVLLMWPYAVVVAPLLKIVAPMSDLVAFTGLYLTLYMGGHTAKEWFNAHYAGRPAGRRGA